jgi:hypothetical protein
MMLREHFLLPAYLLEAEQQMFLWGEWDCNTFISRWVDRVHGVNSSQEIVGKYSTALQAARFYKRFITYREYLTRWDYRLTDQPWQTGDVIIEPNKLWASAHIICGDHLYSMHPKQDLIRVPLFKLDQREFETWRL